MIKYSNAELILVSIFLGTLNLSKILISTQDQRKMKEIEASNIQVISP